MKAEEVKKKLSGAEKAPFSCLSDAKGLIKFDVSRRDFEEGCKHLFEAGMLPVTRLLEELGMDKTDIDEVVLVGGTTRVPRVKEMLREYFGKELNDHIDPDVTVAYGAASVRIKCQYRALNVHVCQIMRFGLKKCQNGEGITIAVRACKDCKCSANQ